MAKKDFFEVVYDFHGHAVYTATPGDNAPLLIKDTSAAGTPTYVTMSGSAAGELKVDFDAQPEVQNLTIYQNDLLQFSIDKLVEVQFRVKMNQAALDAATQFAFGIAAARNDAIDTIAQAMLFRLVGSDAVVVESDDGTTNLDDIATGQTLVNVYKDFTINLATGKRDVRFFVGGQPVAESTRFDMSAYAASLQVFMQMQKTADANVDGFTVDRISLRGRR